MPVRIQTEDFSIDEEVTRLKAQHEDVGAVVSFTGNVRGEGWIKEMFLEHYPGMTEKELEKTLNLAIQKFELLDGLIVHRVGTLKPNEQIVLVVTLSKSRTSAFQAAEFIMDWLKTNAPFWKKEIGAKTENWVEQKKSDLSKQNMWKES